jgi:hypothetical protein
LQQQAIECAQQKSSLCSHTHCRCQHHPPQPPSQPRFSKRQEFTLRQSKKLQNVRQRRRHLLLTRSLASQAKRSLAAPADGSTVRRGAAESSSSSAAVWCVLQQGTCRPPMQMQLMGRRAAHLQPDCLTIPSYHFDVINKNVWRLSNSLKNTHSTPLQSSQTPRALVPDLLPSRHVVR